MQSQKQLETYEKDATAKYFVDSPWTFFRIAFAPIVTELRKMKTFGRPEFSLLDHGCGAGRAMRLLRNVYHVDQVSECLKEYYAKL
jgi:hypothetical protein